VPLPGRRLHISEQHHQLARSAERHRVTHPEPPMAQTSATIACTRARKWCAGRSEARLARYRTFLNRSCLMQPGRKNYPPDH
jgi:hypothetical protein